MAVKSTKSKSSAGKRTSSSRSTASKTSTTRKSSGQTAGKKKTSAAKNSQREVRKAGAEYEDRTNPLLFYEIFLWLMLAFSIFLFISLFGIGGFVGEAVSGFFFGCFGVLAYPLPFVLFFTTAFLISNRKSHSHQSEV